MNAKRKDLNLSSSRDTALSATMVDLSSRKAKPVRRHASDNAAPRGSRNGRVGGGSGDKQIGSNTIPDTENYIAAESGRRNTVLSADSTVDHITSLKRGKAFKKVVNGGDNKPPREVLNRGRPFQRIRKDGPGDNANSEHVSKN